MLDKLETGEKIESEGSFFLSARSVPVKYCNASILAFGSIILVQSRMMVFLWF